MATAIRNKRMFLLISIVMVVLQAGCGYKPEIEMDQPDMMDSVSATAVVLKTEPIQPVEDENEAGEIEPIQTPGSRPADPTTLWVCDCLPSSLNLQVVMTENIEQIEDEYAAEITFTPLIAGNEENSDWLSAWVYVLVAPFPTIIDGIRLDTLIDQWKGENSKPGPVEQILISESTFEIFSRMWGKVRTNIFSITADEEMLRMAWERANTWALIPFEQLDPRWKIIRVDGASPLDEAFDLSRYPLTVFFGLSGTELTSGEMKSNWREVISVPVSNRDPEKLTSLIMTGTTALVRYTAQQMEENGVLYPAGEIADVLQAADITHISNEVPFYANCPPANPVRLEQRFCSDPTYFDLLDFIGVDVVELTGNHIMDWGAEPLLYTIQLYEEHAISYFGGGKNLDDARTPLRIQHNGQQLVFLGCSPAGPESVWADVDSPGSNPCDPEWMETQITSAIQTGTLPIVTFQHLEVEDYVPHSSQRVDFLRAAELGAIIVSGSQSHFAQTMTFVGDRFVHYGLGNLFFDQMYGENRNEFIDRHYFYGGKYISTELLTLFLEDAAKPRFMTLNQRKNFLQKIFEYSNWDTAFPEKNP